MKELLLVWVVLLVGSFLMIFSAPAHEAEAESETDVGSEDGIKNEVDLEEEVDFKEADVEKEARELLTNLNKEMDLRTNKNQLAQWAYVTEMTKENLDKKVAVESENAKYQKEQWQKIMKYPWKTFKDTDLRRQFYMYSVLGPPALPDEKFAEYQKINGDMMSIYSQAKVCDFKNKTNCDVPLDPDITNIMAKSRDPEELKYYWIKWHEASGEKLKHLFPRYVELSNEAAVLNKFTDTAAFWLYSYEDDQFSEIVSQLWHQLQGFYKHIHAYTRRKLFEKYGEKIISRKGPIPAHLLGNMWAQQWHSITDMIAPFPRNKSVDVTPQMRQQGYTPKKMFKLAEDFYTSINLSPMPETFWTLSVLEKPKNRDNIVCQASAFDFYDGKDYRIKQCTTVNYDQLRTAHHEMGHVTYYMQYKDQPFPYKTGANGGFHEAIGDTIVLSMQTANHMKKIGLIDAATVIDEETQLNDLFEVSLRKIILLPFAYIMDLWRWNVFRGKTSKDQYNCAWWKLRIDLQGIEPPIDRTETSFDPGAKFHMAAGVEYLKYFISFVIQFQFHQAMCQAAGQYDPKNPSSKPLHECDIFQNKEAGTLFGNVMKLGASLSWPEAMEKMTGQRKIDASALLQYFSPLQKYLEKENKRTGEHIGWIASERKCT